MKKETSFQHLADMIQGFATTSDVNEALNNSLACLMNYLLAEAGSVFLLDQSKQNIVCKACAGTVDILGLTLSAKTGIVGRAIQSQQCQIIRDVAEDKDFNSAPDKETGFTTRSILCAPLTIHGTPLGAIELINKRPDAEGTVELFNHEDQQLLTILAATAALAIHNAGMVKELIEQQRIDNELQLARTIQESFLPENHGHLPIAGINYSANEVSGDFYDFLELEDGAIAFCIGDVSGKGVNASLLMAMTSSLFHCLIKIDPSPVKILHELNQEICEKSVRGMFISMVCGVFYPKTCEVTLANAGHLPSLIRDNKGQFTALESSGPPLGIIPQSNYGLDKCNLNHKSLYLFTDGLSEGLSTIRELDQIELVIEAINHNIDFPLVERLHQIVKNTVKQGQQLDDVTLLIIDADAVK